VERALVEAGMDVSAPDEVVFHIPEQVVTIRAVVQGPRQTRFARSAIVRIAPRGGRGFPMAQILTWIAG